MFAQFLAWQKHHPGTVENYVSSVRVVHKLAGLSPLDTNNIHYKLLNDSLKKQCREPVRQASPIDEQKLCLQEWT